MASRASSNFLPSLSIPSYLTKFCTGAARNAPPITKGLIALAGLTYGINYAVQGIALVILNATCPRSNHKHLDNFLKKAIIHLAIPVSVSAAITFISRIVFRTGYGRTHFVALALFTTFTSALHTGINYLKMPADPTYEAIEQARNAFIPRFGELKPIIVATIEATTEQQKAAAEKDPQLNAKRMACTTAKAASDTVYLHQMPPIWDELLSAFPADIQKSFPYADTVKALTFPRIVCNLLREPQIIQFLPQLALLLRQETLSQNLKNLLESSLFAECLTTLISFFNAKTVEETFSMLSSSPDLVTCVLATNLVLANNRALAVQGKGYLMGDIPIDAQSLQALLTNLHEQTNLQLQMIPDQDFESLEDSQIGLLICAYMEIFKSLKTIAVLKQILQKNKNERLLVADAFDALSRVLFSKETLTKVIANQILIETLPKTPQTNSDAWALQIYERMMRRLGIEPMTFKQEAAAE